MTADQMAIAGQPMSADAYLAVGEGLPRTQLIAGEVVLNAPRLAHQELCSELLTVLRSWTREGPGRGLAVLPLDIRLDDDNVYNPDVLWYAADHAPREDDEPPYPMPDIAVEVRSPSTWRHDVGAKRSAYEQAGLRELWLVDARAGAVRVFRRSIPAAPRFDVVLEIERDERLSSPQLPGFSLALEALFADMA